MVPKAKKEAPSPSQAKVKAKALKAKKAVLKGIHNHKKNKNIYIPSTFWGLRHCTPKGSLNILRRRPTPRRNKLDHCAIITFPNNWVSHEEKSRQRYTCVHCGCQGQQAPDQTSCEEVLWQWVANVNTLIRPDGEKRACVWLIQRLWCFGCCQQNWDHLNWVWLILNIKILYC